MGQRAGRGKERARGKSKATELNQRESKTGKNDRSEIMDAAGAYSSMGNDDNPGADGRTRGLGGSMLFM